MPSLAILDSGPLLASINRADPHHDACLELLRGREFDFLIPAMCVAEVSYLVGSRLGPEMEAALLGGLEAFDVRAPAHDDWPRIAELVLQYSDLPLGGTDASVLVAAERWKAETIVTLDRRHFEVARSRNGARALFPPSKSQPKRSS
jgi:predicted nucleic acid-binding protein